MSAEPEVIKAVEEKLNEKPKDEKIRYCLILRGLPGTGKTTLTNFLLSKGAWSVSVSEYWSKDNPFQKDKVNAAYEWCFQQFKQLISGGAELIVVDNSNLKKFHFHHYVDYAQRHGYLVGVVTMPHNHLSEKEMSERSSTGTPQLTVRKLIETFEWQF